MRVTGIWQTVWLERVGTTFVRDWVLHTDPATGRLEVQARCDGPAEGLNFEINVSRDGKVLVQATAAASTAKLGATVSNVEPWTPDNPVLYDLEFRLRTSDGKVVNRVKSYAGFRSVSTAAIPTD